MLLTVGNAMYGHQRVLEIILAACVAGGGATHRLQIATMQTDYYGIFLGGENISLSTWPTNSALFTSTTSALCTSTTLCMGMGRDILGLSGHTVVNGFLSFVLFLLLHSAKTPFLGTSCFAAFFGQRRIIQKR